MNIKLQGLTLAVATALSVSTFSAQAAVNGADARSVAMGGTGVASASYLTASFYNPALVAHYNKTDDFGVLLPAVGVSIHDPDELNQKVEDFQDVNDELEMAIDNSGGSPVSDSLVNEWKAALMAMDEGKLKADISIGAAVAVPNRYLSMSLFTQAQIVSLAQANIDPDDLAGVDGSNPPDLDNLQSDVLGIAGGIVDVGLTMGKSFELPTVSLPEQKVSVGISPKIQQLIAVSFQNTVSQFDNSDFEFENEYQDDTAFNLDIGLAYQPIPTVTLGFSGRNLFKQELETNTPESPAGQPGKFTSKTLLVEPKYTLGAAYSNSWFTAAADVDLTEQKYFKEFDLATQYARLGMELNGWDWVQFRAGYSLSLTDSAEDTMSAGIGLSPFGVVAVDLALQYGQDNNYGAALQFGFTM
ncbi:conjugal transfer protein TraF [Photobacterium sp. WH77]|uniref:conjugal transfer protein TraF n=1 Tax=unclassified Photobacterium TaxID=2628852 RepID=UPI001EDC09CE|nr:MULTISPECIES: conjugal transfer protein TraF [unclassified Photobacterium]MCG2839189.1 conjugal transfer protein TraF [Photobacterium sp. WH77]MCG2846806.1 conjugal transfer protein TraF [Photobacterium sp. WH80]